MEGGEIGDVSLHAGRTIPTNDRQIIHHSTVNSMASTVQNKDLMMSDFPFIMFSSFIPSYLIVFFSVSFH